MYPDNHLINNYSNSSRRWIKSTTNDFDKLWKINPTRIETASCWLTVEFHFSTQTSPWLWTRLALSSVDHNQAPLTQCCRHPHPPVWLQWIVVYISEKIYCSPSSATPGSASYRQSERGRLNNFQNPSEVAWRTHLEVPAVHRSVNTKIWVKYFKLIYSRDVPLNCLEHRTQKYDRWRYTQWNFEKFARNLSARSFESPESHSINVQRNNIHWFNLPFQVSGPFGWTSSKCSD